MTEDDAKKVILALRQYGVENYDKQLVYLAGGTLGISITYLKNNLNADLIVHQWIIIIAWVLLTLSLISNLLSHKSTISATEAWLDSNAEYEKLNRKTETLNNLALFTFLGGLILFILFISLNALA